MRRPRLPSGVSSTEISVPKRRRRRTRDDGDLARHRLLELAADRFAVPEGHAMIGSDHDGIRTDLFAHQPIYSRCDGHHHCLDLRITDVIHEARSSGVRTGV